MSDLPVLDLTPLTSAPPPRRPDDLPVLNLTPLASQPVPQPAPQPQGLPTLDLTPLASASAPATPEPSLAATVVPAGPPPDKSGFFTGIGAGGQEAVRLGAQTLQGRAFEVDPSAPPPDTGDEGWWYRFGKGVGYSAPTMAAGLGGGAIGTAIGAAGGPTAPVTAPVAGLIGAGLGVGAMSLAQDLAPTYAQQIQAGKTHDEAVNYAWEHGVVTGSITAATAPLFALTPFKGMVGNLLYQSFVGMPAAGAATRIGVPAVMGEPLPSLGELAQGASQDVVTGLGFGLGHHLGTRAIEAARPPVPDILPLPPAVIDRAARERLAPAPTVGQEFTTERAGVPAAQPAFPQAAPEQPVATAEFGPAPTRIDVTPTGPEGARPSEPVPAAAAPAPPVAEAPATREGPPPSAPAVASAPRLPAEEPLPARSAASEAEAGQPGAVVEPSPRPPEPVTGEPVDRPGATPGRPGEVAPVGAENAARVEPTGVPGGPGARGDIGERPGDTQGAAAGERPVEPATVSAEPATSPAETPATEQAPAVAGLTTEQTAIMRRNIADAEGSREGGVRVVADQLQYMPEAGREPSTPSEREAAHVIERAVAAEIARGGDPQAFQNEATAARRGAETEATALAPITREAPARAPEDYRKLDPNIPAEEYVRRLAELRDNKPRPIDKLWRNPETAPPEQVAAAREALRAWNQEYRQVARAQKLAEERDNAAYRARQEAPAPLEDQAVVLPEAGRAPGPREEAGTTGPHETVPDLSTESLPVSAPTQLERLTAERDRLAAKSRTLDESRELRQLNRQIEDLQPRPGGDTQLGKLLDTRDALEAKSRTLDETLKLRGVNKQIADLRRAEERRGGRKLPYSGQPPEAGRPKDFLDYKFNDGTSVVRSVFREAGYDPDVATQREVQWQNRVLTKHMKDTFGFSDVEVAGYRPGADASAVEHVLARDAMLDMFRGAKDGMATMGLPYESLSLGGKLKLIIEPAGKGNYYGAYVPAAGELRVRAGANSLGHEWTHAWDHELTQWATGNSAQMTRLFSQHTRDGNLDPTNDVHAAFAKVLNTMFYDDGALALHRINLEIAAQKTDRAGAPTKAALEAQRQLDLLEKGASQQRIKPSEFRQRSAQVGKAAYWASPWELLARSHEAYIAWKMGLEGKDPRGFVMPDEAYINETDRQLSLAYPKAEDRARIFAAFDELHVAMLKEQVLSGGKPPGKWADYGVSDPHYQDKTAPGFGKTMVGRAFNEEAAKYSNLSRSVANVALRDKTRPTRPGDLTWWDGLKDGFKAITYSTHGMMETLIARAPKAAQEHLTDLLDRLAAAPGEGRFTRENFEEAIRNRTRGWMSQYANILKNNGLDPEHMPPTEDAALRHLMVTGETSYEGKPIPAHIVKAAGDLRFLMDKMWRASYNAGLDVGYSSRYFPRLYDMAKFFSDESGFRTAATKLYRFMFDKELGAPGADPQSTLEKWTTLSKVERAQAADPNLETQMGELNRNLRRQRTIEENPNPTPAETAELAQLKIDATTLAKAVHDPLGDHVASIAADHWHARMAKGNHADFDTIGPSGKYLNARTLPPEADVIMKDFLRTDTRDAIPNYIHAVARKISYAERFGAKGEYLDAAFEKLRNVPGINHADMQDFRSLIDNITGRANSQGALYNKAQSLHNVLHAIGSIALMPRAMWSALAEPMNAALATGSARVGFKTFVNQVGFLWDRASALERTEFANFLNVTQSAMMDSILLSRMSADYADSPRLNRLMTMYYKVTGLTQLTNSQRTGAAAANNWFLGKLARDYLDIGTSTRRENARDNAERWFNELGINPTNHEAFAKWMTDLDGNLPSIERLQTDDMASAYGLAIRRLTDRVIQDPYKIDRAAFSNVPLLGLAFQMMSFNYQFQRNVLNPLWAGIEHSYGRAKLRAQDKGAGNLAATGQGILAAGGAATHAAAMAGTVIGAGLMTTALRQLLFAPDQWKQHEADGDLEDYLLNLTFQRSGLNGTLDPIIQLFSNLRYNADVTSLIGGATPHWIGRNAQDIIQPFVTTNDSPNSNTRIFNATRGAYNLFGVPLMATGLTMAGNIGGPISKLVAGGLLQYGTSPGAAAGATEAIVGSPKGAKREKETADGLPKLPELPALPELPGLPGLPGEGSGTQGAGGGLIPWGLVDDIAVPAWRYGAPVVGGLPRTVKGAAVAAGALYGGSKYLEATEPFRGQPAPEPKKSAQQ